MGRPNYCHLSCWWRVDTVLPTAEINDFWSSSSKSLPKHNGKTVLWQFLCVILWISNWHLRRNYYLIQNFFFFGNFYFFVLCYKNVLGKKKWNDPEQILDTERPQKPLSVMFEFVMLSASESWIPEWIWSSISWAEDPKPSTKGKNRAVRP